MKENLRSLSSEELKKETEKSFEEIRKARFQFGVTRSLENPKKIRSERKRIARLLTIARERELEAQGKLKKNPGLPKQVTTPEKTKGKKK